jgi:hypothetical protein
MSPHDFHSSCAMASRWWDDIDGRLCRIAEWSDALNPDEEFTVEVVQSGHWEGWDKEVPPDEQWFLPRIRGRAVIRFTTGGGRRS